MLNTTKDSFWHPKIISENTHVKTITQFDEFKDIVINGKSYCDLDDVKNWTNETVYSQLNADFVKLKKVISEVFQDLPITSHNRSYLFHLKLSMFLSLIA